MEKENKIYYEKLINCIHNKYKYNIQIIFFFAMDYYNEEAL